MRCQKHTNRKHTNRKHINRSADLFLGLGLLLLVGCGSSQKVAPMTGEAPSAADGVSRRLMSHMRALASDDLQNRETSSQGEAHVSNYIASHFSRFDLQPPVAGGYERSYPLRKHLLDEQELWLLGPDTVQFVPGRDFVVHPESATGRVDVRVMPGRSLLSGARSVLRLDTTAAAPAVFEPGQGGIRLVLAERARPAFERTVSYATTVRAMVSSREDIVSGRHAGGLYAGAVPRMRDSLLVILVRMDVLESDVEASNGAIAAFLESARRVQMLRLERTPIPRSIYFAAYSGTEEACQGPDWLVRNIPWSRKAITGVLHVGPVSGCWDRMDHMTVVEPQSQPPPDATPSGQARRMFDDILAWITVQASNPASR